MSADDHDDINDADWWKNGKPAPASGPARAADGPFSHPLDRRAVQRPADRTVDKLSEGELIRLGDTGEFIYYVQDKLGSHNYYFHKAMTEYFATEPRSTRKKCSPASSAGKGVR
jgi:hypothetical protein